MWCGALTSLGVSRDDLVWPGGLCADLEESVDMTPRCPLALEMLLAPLLWWGATGGPVNTVSTAGWCSVASLLMANEIAHKAMDTTQHFPKPVFSSRF